MDQRRNAEQHGMDSGKLRLKNTVNSSLVSALSKGGKVKATPGESVAPS